MPTINIAAPNGLKRLYSGQPAVGVIVAEAGALCFREYSPPRSECFTKVVLPEITRNSIRFTPIYIRDARFRRAACATVSVELVQVVRHRRSHDALLRFSLSIGQAFDLHV